MRPSDFIRSTSFRLALFYLGVFIVSSLALGAFVSWSSSVLIERQVEEAVDLDAGGLAERYRDRGVTGLADLIAEHLRQDSNRQSVYVLLGPDGSKLVGNLSGWPKGVAETDGWARFEDEGASGSSRAASVVARTYSLPEGYDLLVGRVLTEATKLHRAINRALGWGLGLTFILGALGAVVSARHLVRRVEEMNKTAHSIIRGDMKSRMVLSGAGDEFDRLAQSFNAMMDEIEHLVDSIRSVSDNIAHDLRTPLNRLRSRIEVALLSSTSSEDHRDVLAATIQDADHLLGTFNALLAISRAESGERLHQFSFLDPALLVADVAELYEPLIQDKGQSLVVQTHPGLQVWGDRHLLFQALANLLDNAVKYTPATGQIRVQVGPVDGGVTIVVADSGPGIPELDRDRVLDRFVRLDATRTSPGNGLGLSLVRAVSDLHGAVLSLGDNCPGLIVRLTFPHGH